MTTATQPKRIYLAGPTVFFPNAAEHFAQLKLACLEHGFEGVAPTDGDVTLTGSRKEMGLEIYRNNIAHIRNSDAVLADLRAFRNPVEPDSGTVFELGVAVALGKPVAGYLPEAQEHFASRVRDAFGSVREEGAEFDRMYGMQIEDFDMPLNLMLAGSTPLFRNYFSALQHLAKVFRQQDAAQVAA